MQQETNIEPIIELQKFYIKDLSFESPVSPEIFQQEWKPEVKVEVSANNRNLADKIYEVVVRITCSVTAEKKSAFLVEVEQAGVFTIANFPDEQFGSIINAYCPNMLFPYAREVISDLSTKGGFMPLLLAPVNFDYLYARKLEKEKEESGEPIH